MIDTTILSTKADKKPTVSARKNNGTKIQMLDLARLAGVSGSTVSRALNGSPLISSETKIRIAELARTLNYSVNQSAKNLRSGENKTIAVIIPYDQSSRQGITDPFFLGMLGSLADALTEQGYDLLLSRVDSDHLDELGALYDTGRAMGVIVIGQWGHHDQLNALASRQIPIVVWGAQLARQLYCSVGSDNVAGGRLATEHLLSVGRQRILFMGNIDMPEANARYQGYCEALLSRGLDIDPTLFLATPFTAQAAQTSMRHFLSTHVQFDAIVAASDVIAINAMGVLAEHGISVPGNVSVVGYDDIDLASHSFPPLTTVRQSLNTAGTVMLDALREMIDNTHADSKLLPTELVLRGSTAQKV
jgi:DNA-binding LacI/PurR family transcriptional regulator